MKLFPGLAFYALGTGDFVLKDTRRADLAAGRCQRGKVGSTIEIGAVIETPSMVFGRRVALLLGRKFGRGAIFTAAQMEAAADACRRNGFPVHRQGQAPKTHKSQHRKPILQTRTIEDPMLTVAEKLHRIEEDASKPRRDQPGYLSAVVNVEVQIGGLARVRGLTEPQREGAKDFKSAADHAQIGGSRAIDYESPRVDVSGARADLVEEIGADARATYTAARKALGEGTLLLRVAEKVIVEGKSITECAEYLGMGTGGQARRTVTRHARAAASVLARHFGHDRRNQHAKLRGELDGERPALKA